MLTVWRDLCNLQSIGRRYVRYFNTKYQRSGTLWEGRFKACLIDTDAYLLSCYRYIELNPIRAKMAQYPGGISVVELSHACLRRAQQSHYQARLVSGFRCY